MDTNGAIHAGPRIIRNKAGEKGGGVLFDGDVAKLDKALRTIAQGNNATFDPEISTPLQRIDIVGDKFVQLASRRNRTDTLNITVKLTGHLGVSSGGVHVQVSLGQVIRIRCTSHYVLMHRITFCQLDRRMIITCTLSVRVAEDQVPLFS